MVVTPAQAFLSYAHADDEFLDGGITWLRRELQRGMRALTGEPFDIFQDKDGIAFGEHWPDRIEDALIGTRFLIPILTPSYFASPQCRAEAATFLDLEKQASRQDLILPIYLIEADTLESEQLRAKNDIAARFYERQYADWRDAAFDLRNSPRIKLRAFDLAKQIKAASMRFAVDAPPIVPAQGPGIRFGLNKDGKIDRAPDEPSEVRDDDPRLCSLQTGLQEACENFLNSFHGDAGRNAFGRLIDNVEAYREAVTRPLTQIQLTDVYRHGLAIQNWMLTSKRNIDRLDPRPDLEDDQQAALTNLLGLHGPFILSTKEGEALQAKADQDQLTAEERAKLWSPDLSDAAEASDHATDRAKAVLRNVNHPGKDDTSSNRHALLARNANRNFLTATGEAATGKDFSDIGEKTASEAGRSASRFLLKNEKLIKKLSTSAELGLGWLASLITWLGELRNDQIKVVLAQDHSATSELKRTQDDIQVPGLIFRDIDALWCPEMVVIPPGKFMMGSPEEEPGRNDDEGPHHQVAIAKSYAIGRFPVTFEEFDFFCDATSREKLGDSGWGRGQRPVINVSWNDAKAYCLWLSGQTGNSYRLPSESEWEYACRAGSVSAYSFGEVLDEMQANVNGRVEKTSEVGAFTANAFKLFDMHGNVWEWCEDFYHGSYQKVPSNGEPMLLASGLRVLRGGSWVFGSRDARAACRYSLPPAVKFDSLGFRCLRVIT